MIWWLKARRLLPVLLPGTAACVLIVALAHDRAIDLPGVLNAGANQIFLMQLIPLLVTSTLAHCLAQRLEEAEAVATRDPRRLDTLTVLTCVSVVAVAGLAIGAAAGSDEATTVGRNTAFLTGLMLLAEAVHPKAATVAPVGWVFAIMFLGHSDYHRPWPWAVTLHAPWDPPALVACAIVFLGGLIAQARIRHTP
ncbi:MULTISPECIES: hypothetical protein [unclassified Streptomyces]|uniref:hypothetical protein n=1 Tax=unclassified Streptomyces TaxID=2593676 RepID=UPI000749F2C0|nr:MULTISPECIES: hypothetical protein [unclassified Streptomyces]KUL53714.1 hypothetical protein ADL30_18900 [Streptomyces sp. NRRL S-1521]THC54220.1 hypothetical protein E7X58_06520 [Streptomyces sp. A1499]